MSQWTFIIINVAANRGRILDRSPKKSLARMYNNIEFHLGLKFIILLIGYKKNIDMSI